MSGRVATSPEGQHSVVLEHHRGRDFLRHDLVENRARLFVSLPSVEDSIPSETARKVAVGGVTRPEHLRSLGKQLTVGCFPW